MVVGRGVALGAAGVEVGTAVSCGGGACLVAAIVLVVVETMDVAV